MATPKIRLLKDNMPSETATRYQDKVGELVLDFLKALGYEPALVTRVEITPATPETGQPTVLVERFAMKQEGPVADLNDVGIVEPIFGYEGAPRIIFHHVFRIVRPEQNDLNEGGE